MGRVDPCSPDSAVSTPRHRQERPAPDRAQQKIPYLEHSTQPTLLSSVMEDYFLGSYCFNRGRYANTLAGLTHMDDAARSFPAYRFHDEDPIFFQKGLRLTCRCGEEVNGKKLHDPPDTRFTTYAWVYEW